MEVSLGAALIIAVGLYACGAMIAGGLEAIAKAIRSAGFEIRLLNPNE